MLHWRFCTVLLCQFYIKQSYLKCSYLLIGESAFIFKFLLSILLFGNILITKEYWKMIGDVSFYYPLFKPSVHCRVCDDIINRAGYLSRNT